jgi:hypothetical protein
MSIHCTKNGMTVKSKVLALFMVPDF